MLVSVHSRSLGWTSSWSRHTGAGWAGGVAQADMGAADDGAHHISCPHSFSCPMSAGNILGQAGHN